MSNVVVDGFPADLKRNKIIFFIKANIKNMNVDPKFWIKDMSTVPGTETMQITVEFASDRDAQAAQKFLNNFQYKYSNNGYPLRAYVDDENRNSVLADRGRRPHYERSRRYTRSRSRSPLSGAASKLDMELELLKKQRMVIEEERRLLLERKKLELIREFGPSAAQEFDHIGRSYERFRSPERRRSLERRWSPERRRSPQRRRSPHRRWTPERMYKGRGRAPSPRSTRLRVRPKKIPKKAGSALPLFVFPCRTILNEMKETMKQHCSAQEAKILVKLIRTTLRKRLAVALEDKTYMATPEIMVLYRELYPADKDEELVKTLLGKLRESHLPSLLNVNIKKEKTDEGTTPDTGKKVEKKVEKKETVQEANHMEKEVKNEKEDTEETIDKNIELGNECAVSLDASEIDLALGNANEKEWLEEGSTEWVEVLATNIKEQEADELINDDD